MTHKQFAINLAKEAGKIMLANFGLGMKKEWKVDSAPVTVTDTKINKMVIDSVKKNFPDHGVLGEEESYNAKGKEYLWVCDPVDGTVPFSHGLPTFVFHLALVKNGSPVLGVLYDPVLKRLAWAEKNKGGFFNGKKMKVSRFYSADMKLVGIPTWSNGFFSAGRFMTILLENGFRPIDIGSHSYMSMMLGVGEFAGVVYSAKYAHDAAAVKIIVEEAGGKVTDLYGKDQRYDGPIRGFLASNRFEHNKLLAAIKLAGKN